MKKRAIVDNNDIYRFQRYLPENGDETLIILKCHLFAEELLMELVNNNVKNPSVLTGSRLTFNHYRCLAEAIIGKSEDDWLWRSLSKLNSIRNSLAHNLETSTKENEITNFIKLVLDNNSFNWVKINGFNDFELALFRQHITLSALKSYENRKAR